MSDIVERLAETGDERQRATAHGIPEHYLHVVAKISQADGLLMKEAAAEITALRERVEKLEAALRPFAEEAARYEPPEGDDEQLLWGEFKLTIGSLRRARAALEQKP